MSKGRSVMKTIKIIMALKWALLLFFAHQFTISFADDEIQKADEAVIIKGKDKPLTLSMGATRVLEFPFSIGPVFLGDPTVLKFDRMKGEGGSETKLIVTPLKPGTTDLTVHDSTGKPRISYAVRVTREDLSQVISQLEELLGDIEGVKIRSVAGTVIIDGEIVLPKDMIRVNRVVDALRDRDAKSKEVPIRNLATISKLTMSILAERIEREIGSPEITVKVINNNLFIEGTASDELEGDRATKIAQTYVPEVVVYKAKGDADIKDKKEGGGESADPVIYDFLKTRRRAAPPPAPDIKITVNFVELNNDYDRSFNFNWRPLAQDDTQVKFDSTLGELTSTLVATVSGLLPKLAAEKTHNHARVLKQQQLVVKDKSDQPASIDSSIDIYSSVLNANGVASLTQVPIQNSVKIKAATIDGSDSIDLGIQLSLGSVVGNNQGQPIVARNSLATSINVKNGDSAAIGGFAIDEAFAGYNRAPAANSAAGGVGGGGGLGGGFGFGGANNQNPNQSALFNLNRSKAFNRRKQQYIIFVTPEVIKTASAGNEDMTRKFRLNSGEK